MRTSRESMNGKSHAVTTFGFVLDIGMLPNLQVIRGVGQWHSVYDEGVHADDLCGSIVYRVPKDPSTEMELKLSMLKVRIIVLKLTSY